MILNIAPGYNGTMENALNAAIRAWQSGYMPGEKKTAFLTEGNSPVAASATDAVIRRVGDEYPMLLAPIGIAARDLETGEMLRTIDFTPLKEPGRYFIDIPGVGRSESFQIGDDVYAQSPD